MTKITACLGLFLALASVPAHADEVRTPNLDRLCAAAVAQGSPSLGMLTLLPTANMLLSVNLNCIENYSFEDAPAPNQFVVSPSVKMMTTKGFYSTTIELAVREFSFVRLPEVKGNPQLGFVVRGPEDTIIASRLIMNLDANGQPVFEENRFGGIVEATAKEEASGTYVKFGQETRDRVCASLGDHAEETELCQSEERELIRSSFRNFMVEAMDFSLSVHLGWLAGEFPTNRNLTRVEGQVPFARVIEEITASTASSAIPDDEVQAILKTAVEKIQNAEE